MLYAIPKNKEKRDSDIAINAIENEDTNDGGKLIQDLLGIQDSKILDEMLDSADSAARLLGVKDALSKNSG